VELRRFPVGGPHAFGTYLAPGNPLKSGYNRPMEVLSGNASARAMPDGPRSREQHCNRHYRFSVLHRNLTAWTSVGTGRLRGGHRTEAGGEVTEA
jgi:hypothetical protein